MDDLKKNNNVTEDTNVTRLPLTSDYVFKRIFAREENNCKHSIEKISEIADLSTEKVKKIIG